MANEVKLLKKCLKGDSRAFEIIVAEYQGLVCAITYSGIADVQRSEELAHQTFINAWKNLSQLKDLSRFRPWLCTIARNNIRNFINKNKRDILQKAKPMENINDTAADDSGPLESVIKKEHIELVNAAIGRIPERYREPLVLYYRQQQSVKQVAQSLDLSEEIVKKRLQRGREKIKAQLSSIVEETLSATGPKKAFTALVMGSIAAIAIKGSGVAAAAIIAGTSTTTGIVSTVLGTVAGKIITAAAVVAIGVGSVLVYKQVTTQNTPEETWQTENIAAIQQQQKAEPDKPTAQTTIISNEDIKKDAGVSKAALEERKGIEVDPVKVIKDISVPETIAEYQFKPKGVLSGRITDVETGEPVIDARVKINEGPIYEAITDPNGFYYFKDVQVDGNQQIRIISKEYVGLTDDQSLPSVYLSKDKQTVKHFQLPKACMIDIQVVDERGDPIKEAQVYTVSLTAESPNTLNGGYETQDTDEDGYFLIGGLPPSKDDYLIFAVHDVYEVTHIVDGTRYGDSYNDYSPGHIIVNLNDPEVIESRQIVLKDGVDVKGHVEYSDGVPASDVGIAAEPQWWHANRSVNDVKVDENGYFTLKHITEGNYNIVAHIKNPITGQSTMPTITQTKLPLEGEELLAVTLPYKSPQSLASIAGEFVFKNTSNLNRSISIDAYSPQHGHFRTDWWKRGDVPDNSFIIDRLEPGNYRLTFRNSIMKEVVLENITAPAEGLVIEVEYTEKPTIRGVVINPQTKEPVNDFKVRINKIRSLGGANYGQTRRWHEFRNDGGQFQVEVIDTAIYQLEVIADGFAVTKSDEIDVRDDGLVTIELAKGGSIKGTVIDEKGIPVKNAKVLPYSLAGNNQLNRGIKFESEEGAVITNVDGSFIIENLSPGDEILKVMHPDYCFVVKEDVEVVIGEVTEVKVTLNNGGAIEGYVYDENGKPQANVALSVLNGLSFDPFDEGLASAITDKNGFYHIDTLPEQLCHIKRKNEQSALGVVKKPIFPEPGKTLRVDLGKGTIVTGRLIVDSEPLANTKVLLSGNFSYHSGAFRYNGLTDSEGNFKLNGIMRGKFSLYYPNPVKRNEWIKFTTFDIADEDIDLGVVPKVFGSVVVNITQQSKEHPWSVAKVSVQEGIGIYGAEIGVVEIPETEGQPYVIRNILPGKHILLIERSDYMKFRREFEVIEDNEEIDIDLKMPQCSASFGGKLLNSKSVYLGFWSENYDLVGSFRADENNEFKVENLPADKYYFGSKKPNGDDYIITQLELSEGEQKTIDIEIEELTKKHSSYRAIVVDENGIPYGGADVWLEKDGQEIEPYMNNEGNIYFITEPGRYLLVITSSDHKDIEQMIEVKQLDPNNPITAMKVIRLEKK